MTLAQRIDRFDGLNHAPGIDDPWIIRRILAGWTPRAIAAACDGRISLRTAYRWKKSVIGLETVRVGKWEADFAIRRQGPIRITEWRRAA